MAEMPRRTHTNEGRFLQLVSPPPPPIEYSEMLVSSFDSYIVLYVVGNFGPKSHCNHSVIEKSRTSLIITESCTCRRLDFSEDFTIQSVMEQ